VSRHRDVREAKAFAYLQRHPYASAFELGNAAVAGEKRSSKMSRQGKEAIGISIAVHLMRCKKLGVTRRNDFRLV
jgi:hypothetical protein